MNCAMGCFFMMIMMLLNFSVLEEVVSVMIVVGIFFRKENGGRMWKKASYS